MFSTTNILIGAAGFALGAGAVFLLLVWRGKRAAAAHQQQADGILANARRDAEEITSRAKLAANEDALQLRKGIEDSLAIQRTQQVEHERRLAERETLINSQLERVMRAEKALDERDEALKKQVAAAEAH